MLVPAEPLVGGEIARDHHGRRPAEPTRRTGPTDVARGSPRHDEQQQHRPGGRHVVLATDVEPSGGTDADGTVGATEPDVEREHRDGTEGQQPRCATENRFSR
jgi:hypothetical protein